MTGFDLSALDRVVFDDRGLVTVIAQDQRSRQVLMVAWANREALVRTLSTGEVWFFSRSRQRLWRKGETSGNVLHLRGVELDCDGDSVLLTVEPAGPACHTGATSCFDAAPELAVGPPRSRLELGWLHQILAARRGADPATSYTARLLSQGLERVAQKVGEEGVETVVAALRQDDPRLVDEAADLLYHLLVLLVARDIDPGAVDSELRRRHQELSPVAAAGGGGDTGGGTPSGEFAASTGGKDSV